MFPFSAQSLISHPHNVNRLCSFLFLFSCLFPSSRFCLGAGLLAWLGLEGCSQAGRQVYSPAQPATWLANICTCIWEVLPFDSAAWNVSYQPYIYTLTSGYIPPPPKYPEDYTAHLLITIHQSIPSPIRPPTCLSPPHQRFGERLLTSSISHISPQPTTYGTYHHANFPTSPHPHLSSTIPLPEWEWRWERRREGKWNWGKGVEWSGEEREKFAGWGGTFGWLIIR